MSNVTNTLDPNGDYSFGGSSRDLYPDPSYKPSIADYLPIVYIATAVVIGTFVAVKLHKGTKKKMKPFKVEVKASVPVIKPDDKS